MHTRQSLAISLIGMLLIFVDGGKVYAQTSPLAGSWQASLASPGGPIRFGLEIIENAGHWTAFLTNGEERIEIPTVETTGVGMRLGVDHYASELAIKPEQDGTRLVGQWKKRRGKNELVELEFSASRETKEPTESPESFLGRWSVKFSSSEDPAVAVFKKRQECNQVLGTFLTTTGDYRYLAGNVSNNQLSLSCFDGAHAFLFHARLTASGEINGDFWSSENWHETWKANRDPTAKLPDAFAQTKVGDPTKMSDLMFPDLNGIPRKLDDPMFAGKARIIYVFGSWCPNCHDAAAYFSHLQQRYGDQGLSILGLAFELTGDFERDSEQVRTYLDRHSAKYSVLIAGLADKSAASKKLPLLDRVRSYPTTIFVNSKGEIRGVHTGFSGPATGPEYEALKRKFEDLIEKMLAE